MARSSPMLSRALLLVPALSLGCTEEAVGVGALELSKARIEFGTIQVDATAYESITASNVGDGELRLLSVAVIEGDRAIWEVDQQGAPRLAPGESTEITFRFTPIAPGQAEAVVRIRNSSEDAPQVDVALAGATEISNDDLDGDGYSPADGDCDDSNRMTWPGAEELCDGQDNDCDGQIDATEADADADGYRVCEGDCDDEDPTVRPGLPEICDGGKDTDCDGVAQDYLDEDEDGWTLCASDCDDHEPLAHPTREEVCDGIDNDCNDDVDDIDRDGDGRGACPGAGDCDDTDPDAYGQVVDSLAEPEGDGSTDAPFNDILDAINAVDDICRTVVLRRGTYELSRTWRDGYLRIEGAGTYPDEVLLSPPVATGYRVFTVADGAILEIANLLMWRASVDGSGSVLHSTDSDIVLEDVVLFENDATGDGGAVYVEGGSLTLERVDFTANAAQGAGGGLAVVDATLTATDSTWESNTAELGGGGLSVRGGQATLWSPVFAENTALLDGGGVDVQGARDVTLAGGRSRLNVSTAGDGGAVHLADLSGTSVLRNTRLQDNAAAAGGGGVAVTGTHDTLRVVNNTSTGDTADGTGGALYLAPSSVAGAVVAWSNVVVAGGGAEAVFAAPASGVSVGWSTVFDSQQSPWTLEADEDAGGNTTDDPLLAAFSDDGDPLDDDLGLQGASPAIDSGPPDGTDGAGQTDWSDLDGSRNDRGFSGGPGGR